MSGNVKEDIVEAFFLLSKKKDIDKINVKDLVTECGISRQAFYYYFQDILEVSEWSFSQKMMETFKKSKDTKEPIEAIRIFVHTMKENQDILTKLRSSGRRMQMEKLLIEATRDYMEHLVREKLEESRISQKNLDFLLNFYSLALSEFMLLHIEDELDEEHLSERLLQLLKGEMNFFK